MILHKQSVWKRSGSWELLVGCSI